MKAKLLFFILLAFAFPGCKSENQTDSAQKIAKSTRSTKESSNRDGASTASASQESHPEFMDKSWTIKGIVLNQHSTVTDDFQAASLWSSNGKYWNEDGIIPQEERETIWKNEGVLANRPQFSARKFGDGKFSLTINDRPRAPAFAVNGKGTHGGIAMVMRESCETVVKIKMTRLVEVTAALFCPEAEKPPGWGIAEVYLVGGDNIYLTSCGTYQGRVSFWLPAGDYEIKARGSSPNSFMAVTAKPESLPLHAVYPRGKRFTVTADDKKLDLGVLELKLPRDSGEKPVDTTALFNKPAPKLNILDARGAPRDMKLEDFHGKWVLLDFWTITCLPCVATGLPELTEFYAVHESQRDQFEILAICNTHREKIRTIVEYEKQTASIRKSLWDDRKLPFPVLIDGQGKTSRDYGVTAWPTTFLIDPNGLIVEGGSLEMLAKKLKELRTRKN